MIIYEFLTVGYLAVFWTMSWPWVKTFIVLLACQKWENSSTTKEYSYMYKAETLFRISWHFSTNFQYTPRVSTASLNIYPLWVDSRVSVSFLAEILCVWNQRTKIFYVSKHWDFMACPGSNISSTTKLN